MERRTEGQISDFDYPVAPDKFNPATLFEKALIYGMGVGFIIGAAVVGAANHELMHEVPRLITGNITVEAVMGGYILLTGGVTGSFIGIIGGVTVGSILNDRHYSKYLPNS